ncbi:hypothetical protein HDU91_005530, partial [Kappamyces sp. JEL0680]
MAKEVFVLTTKPKILGWNDASFWQRLNFSYLSPLMRLGQNKDLNVEQLPEVEDADNSERLVDSLNKAWNKLPMGGRSLWTVLRDVVGPRYLWAAPWFFVEFGVQLTQGYFLSRLLRWVADPVDPNEGWYWATGIVVDAILYAHLHHGAFFITTRTGMQTRIGLIALIFDKALRLSSSHSSSTGKVVNLISNDVQRFEDLSPNLHYVWVIIVQLIGYSWLMYLEIGWSFLAAIATLFLLVPIQGYFGQKFKVYRGRTVGFRDSRIKSLSDMISGILIVKLYAWEAPLSEGILKTREKELEFVWKGNILKAFNQAFYACSNVFVNSVTFIVFYLAGGELSGAKVFSVITYLEVLKLTVTNYLPLAIQLLSECIVSVQRIEEFLNLPEVEPLTATKVDLDDELLLEMKGASFAWQDPSHKKDIVVLKDLTVSLKRNQLVCLVGPVGAGKTSFLSAILGDAKLVGGGRSLNACKLGYVSQTPWILSGTVKDNILFGQEYNQARFQQVVDCCALQRDLELFPDGADTFIGERGVTLSGGQKARVALARAVYLDADLYLFDDPLAAVDTNVSRHIFENCIRGLLRGKSIVLVTHNLPVVKWADQVLVLEHGQCAAFGSYQDILQSPCEFARLFQDLSNFASEGHGDSVDDLAGADIQPAAQHGTASGKINGYAKEEMAKGSIPFSSYWRYLRSGSSVWMTLLLIFSLSLGQAMLVASDFWLARWASLSGADQRNNMYAYGLLVLMLTSFCLAVGRAILFFYVCICGSRTSFKQMLHSALRAPMAFFQANPHGRIMNRFSKDINIMDESLPQTFFTYVTYVFIIVGVLAVACIVLPWVLLSLPILGFIFMKIRRFYMMTSRQIKRLEAVTRSPVYSLVPSTLEGLSTIRAFGAQTRIRHQLSHFQNTNTRVFINFLGGSRWLAVRLDLIVAAVISLVLYISVPLRAQL